MRAGARVKLATEFDGNRCCDLHQVPSSSVADRSDEIML